MIQTTERMGLRCARQGIHGQRAIDGKIVYGRANSWRNNGAKQKQARSRRQIGKNAL